MSANTNLLRPKCVAQTDDECLKAFPISVSGNNQPNFFRSAIFSSDGTTIITHHEDHSLRTYILPENLLDNSPNPHLLTPISTSSPAAPLTSYTLYPSFTLSDPSTTLILSAETDLPITLRNALHFSTPHARYTSQSPTTERYNRTTALTFTPDGQHFLAGSKDTLSIFATARDGSSPLSVHKTSSTRKARKLVGPSHLDHDGPVSALNINSDGVLACGTFQRNVGLYAQAGLGECITAFRLPDERGDAARGSGVTDVRWTPDGTYLLVAERQSEGVHVYDVRNSLRRVAVLAGRKADTTQRLGIDVIPTVDGCEVWAGGTDGCVRMWRNPGLAEGEQAPDERLALHQDAVSCAIWHPGGAVLATCSGSRRLAQSSDGKGSSSDEDGAAVKKGGASHRVNADPSAVIGNRGESTLKVWTL